MNNTLAALFVVASAAPAAAQSLFADGTAWDRDAIAARYGNTLRQLLA